MAELQVARERAKELLETQVATGRELAERGMQTRSEADYDEWLQAMERWRRMGEAVLAKVYGENSGQHEDFKGAGNVMIAFAGTPWNVDQVQAVQRLNSRNNVIVGLVEQLDLVDEPSEAASKPSASLNGSPLGVFIVHGRNQAVRESVARLLEKAGREVVILHEQANKGRTLIEKFEDHAATAGFAVILLTGDDVGGPDNTHLQPRARQNVVFEMGFFYGCLGRDHVAVLYEPGVEKPSDIDGIVYIGLDVAGAWKTRLLDEMTAE
jgi:predicted nucleotide-binding protein